MSTRFNLITISLLLLLVVVAILLTMTSPLATGDPFLLLLVAVLACTWYGGLGLGLLATALTAVAVLDLVESPLGSFTLSSGESVLRFTLFLGSAVIITLITAERDRARRLAQTQARRQAAIADLGQRALRSKDLRELLALVPPLLTEVLQIETSYVAEVLPDREALRVIAGVGWNKGTIGEVELPAGTGSEAGFTLQTAEPVMATDLKKETRFSPSPLLRQHRLRSGITVLVLGSEYPYAVLGAFSRRRRAFASGDLQFLQALANTLVAAIQRRQAEEAVRKRVEDALNASEQRYRSLFNGMTEGFALHEIICDEQGRPRDYRFLEVNPAFERTTGLKRDEVRGRLASQVLGSGEPGWLETFGKVALTGEPVQFEGYSPMLQQHLALYVYSPAPRQFAVLFMNISERKRTEEQIQTLNQDLARRAVELQAANQELEAFSYSVSHDLRTPLASIDGFSRLVLEDYGAHLPEEGQRMLRLIRENTAAMAALIEDLLLLSRAARQPVKKELVQPDILIRQALEELDRDQAHQDLKVVIGQLPACQADPILLKQVWVNLLSNAFKFTRNRANPCIKIGATAQADEIVYFVQDNGVGFDAKHAEKLFGVFQRFHNQEDYGGSGIGLAIVDRIVRRHGGRVWAESQVDQGATFYFALPSGA